MSYPLIKIAGDASLTVYFGDQICPEVNADIRAFDRLLKEQAIPGIYETVPTYVALTVHYDPAVIRYQALCQKLDALLSLSRIDYDKETSDIEIPVLYGGEYGPDLAHVASHNHLTEEEVIRIHTGGDYLVYMLGFTPGFSYLGGMDPRIATPRLEKPRLLIPAGSVGIGGSQTGIYPIDSPGGWQIIGRTPVKLYDIDRNPPVLLDAGIHIRFVSISEDEYRNLLAKESGIAGNNFSAPDREEA